MRDLSYFSLRAHLYSKEVNQSVSFKLEELETIWFCTRKNVKRKLKQYEAKGKLRYQPGRGRGNPSSIVFTQPFQKEVEEFTKQCLDTNQLEHIVQLLQSPIPKPWITSISDNVRAMFGMQETPENKDVLRLIITRDITTLDPVYSSVTFENHLIRQLGDTLVVYNPATDKIESHLAHHWRVNEDHTVWKFYLRKGVKFHHQSILTSEDVRYTFERFKQGSPFYWLVEDIEMIHCITSHVVEFHLVRSNPFFLRYLTACNLVILPRDIPFDEKQWVGTGAFQLKNRNKEPLVIEAFDQYFLERPFLDSVEFWKIPTETIKTVTFNINSDQDLKTGIAKNDVEVGFRFLAFNFNKPSAVHDFNFRQALFHLLNMKLLAKELQRPPMKEASSFFPWNSKHYPKDAGKVKDLLSASAYQGEELLLYALEFPNAIEEAKWFQKEAEKYGIKMKLIYFSLNDFYHHSLDKEADLLFFGEVSTIDYQLSFLEAFNNGQLIFRRFLGGDHLQIIDKLLKNYKSVSTKEQRDEIIEEVESYLKNHHLIIFMYHPIKNRMFHPMIQDIRFESFGHVDFKKLWVE